MKISVPVPAAIRTQNKSTESPRSVVGLNNQRGEDIGVDEMRWTRQK
jgi:hypothetical protein